MDDDDLEAVEDDDGCEYCGSERHAMEDCPDLKRDRQDITEGIDALKRGDVFTWEQAKKELGW